MDPEYIDDHIKYFVVVIMSQKRTSIDNRVIAFVLYIQKVLKNYINTIYRAQEPLSLNDLDINGNDLTRLGYAGRQIGAELNRLQTIVLRYPTMNQKNILKQITLKKLARLCIERK